VGLQVCAVVLEPIDEDPVDPLDPGERVEQQA